MQNNEAHGEWRGSFCMVKNWQHLLENRLAALWEGTHPLPQPIPEEPSSDGFHYSSTCSDMMGRAGAGCDGGAARMNA